MRRILLSVTVCLCAVSVLAADWNSCQDDLETLRHRASDASDAAESVRDLAEELKEKRETWDQCRSFPLLRSGCLYERSEYESTKRSYDAAKGDLENHLDDVGHAIRSVEFSCGYSFGTARNTPQGYSFCQVLQRYKNTLLASDLLQICMKSRTEEECRKCLPNDY